MEATFRSEEMSSITVPSNSGASARPTPERELRHREDRRLLDRHRRTGDPAAREALVRRFLPLVRSIAGRYRHTSEPFDDLVQVGSVGLLKAIDRFDPDLQTAFTTFAVPTIAGEIQRHFRDRTWSLKVPRGAQDAALRLAGAERDLEGTLGRSPTTAEIAETLGVSIEHVLDARAAALARSTESLDQPWGDEEPEGRRRLDTYQVEEGGFTAAEDTATLAGLLQYLDGREREALRLRFEEDLTQAEIGERIGCSQMHVSRVVRGAIARLATIHEAQVAACVGGTSTAACGREAMP